MEFSNQKKAQKIKKTFNILGIVIALAGLIFLWLKKDTALLATAVVIALYLGFAQFANFCHISFSTANNKVIIRYYRIISFMGKKYELVEFPHRSLVNFDIERSMGFTDLTIAIKTNRGIAEYPSISLSALSKSDIEKIRQALSAIINNNKQ